MIGFPSSSCGRGQQTVTVVTAEQATDVSGRLERLRHRARGLDARGVIELARDEFPGQLVYVSSFGAESVVLLSLIAEVDPAIPVIFIDTGLHFHQTLQYRDHLVERLGLRGVRTHSADPRLVRAHDPRGLLHRTSPDLCCEVRKVSPLEPAMVGCKAWITGRKRFHGGGRVHLPLFEYADGRFKTNPLAAWTADDIRDYLAGRSLPAHPLISEGYPSIGCWPCTERPSDPADIRSGRWAGMSKTECGLHLDRKERPRVF
jgi:phosphoadenosine phosphosulfate reductase